MPDFISWYVVELRQRLAPHFPIGAVEEISSEAESHLRESAADLQARLGLGEAEAAKSAISAFGSVGQVADTYLLGSDSRLLGLRPIWFVLTGAVVAIACWDFHWLSLGGYWDNFGETWENGLAGFIGCMALVAFLAGCRAGLRSFRWPILGIGAAVVAVLPFLLCFWMIGSTGPYGQGISRFHLSRDTANIESTLTRLDGVRSYFRTGIALFSGDRPPNQIPAIFTDYAAVKSRWGELDYNQAQYPPEMEGSPGQRHSPRIIVPYSNGIFAMVDGRLYTLGADDNVRNAMTDWRRKGPEALRSVELQRIKLAGLLASANEARHGRLLFWNPPVFIDAVAWTIVFLPLLLIADTAMWSFSRRRRGLPRRILA